MAKKRASTDKAARHTVPPALPKDQLHKLLFARLEQDAREIKDYVEWQCRREEKVLHARLG